MASDKIKMRLKLELEHLSCHKEKSGKNKANTTKIISADHSKFLAKA